MTLSEKAAYILGLADGVELDGTTKEGKLLKAVIELLGEMAEEVEALGVDVNNLGEYIEEVDHDLGDIEEIAYGADDCDEDYDDCYDCDCDCDDCDCDCDNCDCDCDDEYFEVECPSCGEVICFDGSIDPEELACPACGEKFECIVSAEDLAELDGE